MTLGLIFIATSTLYIWVFDEISGYDFIWSIKGFEAIDGLGIKTILSNRWLPLILESPSQLGLLKTGIVFAVILTPIFGGFAICSGVYYYFKFIQTKVPVKLTDNINNLEDIKVEE